MKKWPGKKSNLLFVVILGIILSQQLPVMWKNLQQKNKSLDSRIYAVYPSDQKVVFPPKSSRAMAIFWASWCGPCKIEMNRLKSSVNSGAIPESSIFAINPFESREVIQKFLQSNNYPFRFIEAPSLGSELEVSVTPTTIFIENGRITSMTSGMSLWGIWRAELFL